MDRHPVFKLEDLKSCIPCPKIYLNFFKLNPVSNSFFPSGMKNHFIISQNFFGIRNESNAKKENDEIKLLNQEIKLSKDVIGPDAKELAKKGVKEIVLTGIHIASYGADLEGNILYIK